MWSLHLPIWHKVSLVESPDGAQSGLFIYAVLVDLSVHKTIQNGRVDLNTFAKEILNYGNYGTAESESFCERVPR